ncbi:Protein of unknown function (DUF604 [Striga hermonthica]|uniref:Phytocyanin domain-containing protein n=1 Tax=Striga hermonthica TaxID=68872 RepID=A0A9N7MYJ3_STRHE|nr:Protein of unknown function (DUF604 [Striga hermonthica]
MQILHVPFKLNSLMLFMLLSCLLCITSLFIFPNTTLTTMRPSDTQSPPPPPETSLDHLVFGIASNGKSWPDRKSYVRLWWRPHLTRGCVFLETNTTSTDHPDGGLPPVCISGDTSRFRYTFRNGLRSAVRVARIVSETVALNHPNVRWFVFGDDDTIFFPENLVRTLSKYDHGLWYYVGSNSESFAQNKAFSFEMAFGGAGFAISYPLAKVLAKVFDSCLERYPHLYGSDSRVQACVAELGVGLTHEPGFHQMDIRGSMFGFLAAHPLRPLISLHHSEAMEPIFPNTTHLRALEHLFRAVKVDSQRVAQQTVCYDRWFSWTISVSWGYAVQIFPRHVSLPDALRTQETYVPWKRGGLNHLYNVDTLGYHADPCRRPVVFFMHDVSTSGELDGTITSVYRMVGSENCTVDRASPRKLEEVRVFSHRMELDIKQLQAPRRHCCDVLPSKTETVLEIAVRECAIFTYLNLAMAANYTVGGPNGGWDQSTDLATWASSITFLEGDNLLFEFTTNHDVTEVSRSDFDSCNPNNPLQPPSTGGSATVALSSAGSRYFICGTPGHCLSGMKLQVDTHAATSPPPQAATLSAPSPAPVSSPPPRSHAPSPSPKHSHGQAGRPTSPPAASPPPSDGSLLAPAAAPSAAGRFSVMGALTACSGFFAIIVLLNF